MKFFAVFACVIAVAVASPAQWTLLDLSSAITNPSTDAALKPVLEGALDIFMDKIFAGENLEYVLIRTTAGEIAAYDLAELDNALSHTTPFMKPYLEDALDVMMANLFAGQQMSTIAIEVPAMDLSYWSLQDLDAALTSTDTDAVQVPYLENALNELMSSIFAGQAETSIVVAMPVAESAPIAVSPAIIGSAPTTTVSAPSSNSPLVQIILNVQN